MSRKIQATKNYRLFSRHEGENRPFDLKKHKRLFESMQKYGFLEEFPIVCYRDKKGALVVKDGQHRLAIAANLNLTVYWVEASQDWDVAVVNSTAKPWVLKDYAEKFAANGINSYRDGIEFADQHAIPIGVAFALLAGTTSFGNCQRDFIEGTFKIKDRKWADLVAKVYSTLVGLSVENIRKQVFIEACMAACRVKDFDSDRLIAGAQVCREKLINYGTRDGFLEMLETVYNFRRHGPKLVPLKMQAVVVMRERNATNLKKKNAKKNGDVKQAA